MSDRLGVDARLSFLAAHLPAAACLMETPRIILSDLAHRRQLADPASIDRGQLVFPEPES